MHQRLDVSHNDDRCRVRNDNAMLVLGIMLRLSNSLFMQWSGYKRRPDHVTTTDFQSALSEDHHRPALRLALSNNANLRQLSCIGAAGTVSRANRAGASTLIRSIIGL